jgi:lipoprotein-releasing system ATP-binding protein
MSSVLKLAGITKTFKQGDAKIEVLQGIDLEIKQGEIVGLVGPSGSGKSTLLHIAGLLDSPTSGEIMINGTSYANANDAARTSARQKIGFVYQFHHLLPEFSALTNAAMPLLIEGCADAYEKAEALLEKMQIAHRRKHLPAELSGGQQQRVAIARAIVHEPAIILADEPTGNLDIATADAVFAVMRKIITELNLSAIIATHNPDLVKKMDRVLKIVDGKIV